MTTPRWCGTRASCARECMCGGRQLDEEDDEADTQALAAAAGAPSPSLADLRHCTARRVHAVDVASGSRRLSISCELAALSSTVVIAGPHSCSTPAPPPPVPTPWEKAPRKTNLMDLLPERKIISFFCVCHRGAENMHTWKICTSTYRNACCRGIPLRIETRAVGLGRPGQTGRPVHTAVFLEWCCAWVKGLSTGSTRARLPWVFVLAFLGSVGLIIVCFAGMERYWSRAQGIQ